MKKTLAVLGLLLFTSLAWALPSEQQVQEAVKQGNYVQAESMMAEVVGAKPNSAKAHYIYAELLARNGNFNKASDETAKARQLDPALGFTDPAKFKSFEDTLRREQSGASRPRPSPTSSSTYAPASAPLAVEPAAGGSRGGGIPSWVWLAGLVLVAVFIWRGFSRSREQGATQGAMAASGMAGGYGPGAVGPAGAAPYGPYGPGGAPMGRPGSGLLGTGLAVAGGVAGGMLLDEMLHKRSDGGVGNAGFLNDGGADPAARELEDRQVDFGNGNDWDSGGGGSVDMGGGGSDGGGSWD